MKQPPPPGTKCRVCNQNEARYTSGCCALCDMKLPEEQRGRLWRLELAARRQPLDTTPPNTDRNTGHGSRDGGE